jgi:phosphoglycolate phosphatase
MTARKVVPAAVLFDLDGTLADSFEGIRYALNAALREEGLPEHDLAWVRAHVGRGAAALVHDAVGDGAGEAVAHRVGARFAQHYRATYLDLTPALPDAGAVLAFVWERTGGKVAVVSNKNEDLTRAWLRHVGLARYVAAVVGPETYGVRKPDPAAVLPVLRAFDIEPSDALLVGDMEVDVATARAVGSPIVAVHADPRAREALLAAGAAAALPAVGGLPAWLEENGSGWRYDGSMTRGEGR